MYADLYRGRLHEIRYLCSRSRYCATQFSRLRISSICAIYVPFAWARVGFLAIGLGIPAPLLLWKYGETLRSRSTFAAG